MKKIEYVIDPVFLLNKSEWNKVFPKQTIQINKRYVLSMFLTNNVCHWETAKRLAKEKSCRHIVIPYVGISFIQKAEIIADAGLEDLISLIRNAECVLTDSFHITVLALIYERNFYTFQRFKEKEFSSTNERVKNILKIANCEDRFLMYGTRSINVYSEIDYDDVTNKIKKVVDESKEYLEKAINRL